MPARELDRTSTLSRLARWLQERSFTLTPEQIGLAEGLRAATAVALIVALALVLHQPLLSWAAFAAFWTCLADPGGPTPGRVRAMASFTCVGTLLAGIGAAVGTFGPGAVAPVLFLVMVLCGLSRVLGAAAAQVGVLSGVVTVVAVGYPRSPEAALQLSGIFLAGSLWALVLCIWIWRVHPLMPARRAVSAIFRELNDMTTALLETRPRSQNIEHRRAVRMTIERARSMVRRIAAGRGDAPRRRALMDAIEAGDRIFAGLIALGHEHRMRAAGSSNKSEIHCLRHISAVLQTVRQELLRIDPDMSRIAAEANRIAQVAEKDDGLAGHVVAACAKALADLTAAKPPSSEEEEPDRPGPIVNRILQAGPVTWRHAFRFAVGVQLSYGVTAYFHLHYGYWATMATVVVMQPQTTTTWPRTVERVIGSMIGGVAAALLAHLLESPLMLLVVIFPLAAATIALRSVNYTLFVLFLTPLFVLVADMMSMGGGEIIAWDRGLNNVLGSLIGLASSLLLWPDHESKGLPVLIAEAVEANLGYAARVIAGAGHPGEDIDPARRAAGVASNSAEVTRQRMVLEGRRTAACLAEAEAVLSALRVVAGATTVAWLTEAPPQCEALDDINGAVAKAKEAFQLYQTALEKRR